MVRRSASHSRRPHRIAAASQSGAPDEIDPAVDDVTVIVPRRPPRLTPLAAAHLMRVIGRAAGCNKSSCDRRAA